MPKYQNRFSARYSILFTHVRKHTTSRARRIILANLLCLALFATTIGLAQRVRKKPELADGPEAAMTGPDVYYISKRALCSRSLAYEQLGIQPIAVSKVILRPVVREGVIEGYDDRLEVLEDGLINDVVFLDRNASGKEAELSAHVCPLHTVSVLPDRKPSRYTASSLQFGVPMNADDIPKALEHWQYWARKTKVAFHILLPKSQQVRVSEVKELVRKTLGISVVVEAAKNTDDFSQLMLLLVERMQKNAGSGREWFVVLSASTFVTSVDEVLLALEQYDSSQLLYLGGLSESTLQKEKHGIFAYGGAGVVLSRPLAETVVKHVDDCLKLENIPFGDGMLSACVSRHSRAKFTVLPTFHQCDLEEDITGLLQSPLQFATINNFIPDGFPLFPTWHSLGPDSPPRKNTYSDFINLFHLSREILSPQNWGIRYRFGTSGRFLLTNGYSVTEFLRPPFPSNHDIRNGVEGTFSNDNDVAEFTFHAAHAEGATKEIPMRHGLREGDDKRSYYLRAIGYSATQASTVRAEKMNRRRKEAAVFIYINEWGNVRRGIEVVWLL